MLQKLYLHKSHIGISVLALTFILSLLISPIVSATSIYDATVVSAGSWSVTNSSGSTYTADLAQAINNVSDQQYKENCVATYSIFMQMDYRSYDVYQPSRYSSEKYARAFATNETPPATQWSADGGTKQAQSLWHNYVAFQLKYENGKVVAFECGGTGTGDYSGHVFYAFAFDDGFTPLRPYLTQNFQVDYPSGYAGSSVPSGTIGGQISGNVQCANTNNIISAVHINAQSGLSGNAKITDDGIGGKNYRYYLSEESPYSLTVLCDGDSFYGPTVESNLYYNYNWVCAPTTPGQNPNLNICAAS